MKKKKAFRAERESSRTMRLLFLWSISVIDFAFAFALTLSLLDFDIVRALRAIVFASDASFTTQAGDVAFLAFLRLIFVPTIVLWRARRAQREKALAKRLADEATNPSKSKSINDDVADDDNDRDDRKPLLVERSSNNSNTRQLTLDALRQIDFDRILSRHSQSLHAVNRIVVAAIFLFLTTCLIFTGVKVVLFQFAPAAASSHSLFAFQASAMSLGVVFMTLELWLARDIIDEASKDEGRLVASVHLHGLHLDESVGGHWCDMCDTRIDDRTAYTCRTCNFDCCLECFKKESRKQSEEAIRGDKGARADGELSNWAYAKRAFVFVKPSWGWVTVALAVIAARSISSILLPSYQGAILDRVIQQSDVAGFWHQVTLYTSFTVSVMLLSSLQSLCFAVAGRKMGALVKNELYRAILVQDIAFFDGVSSGQLTSRLSGDVWAMMQPVQTALGTTVGSTLQLLGALVMCVSTSFRLSVLAFTTIGPIVLLYRVYAQWSRKINYRIWAAWGDSTARATQALKAIRTVRAFSMEPKEIEGFEKRDRRGPRDGHQGRVRRHADEPDEQRDRYGRHGAATGVRRPRGDERHERAHRRHADHVPALLGPDHQLVPVADQRLHVVHAGGRRGAARDLAARLAARHRRARRRDALRAPSFAASSSCATCSSPTRCGPRSRCSRASRCTSPPARRWRSSASRAAASRRSFTC
jgi:ABC-type multidrug transport system fused ATPase/permease subunit